MAALDFPDNPAAGDLFGSSGTAWRWDGARWASTAGASGERGIVAYNQSVVNIGGNAVDLAVPITFQGVAGRTYKLTGYTLAGVGPPDTIVVNLMTSGGTTIESASTAATSGLTFPSLHVVAIVKPTVSGPLSYKLLGSSYSGNPPNFIANANAPRFLMAEDITYEAGSSGGGVPSGPWTAVSFLNGWSNYGGAQFPPMEWRKVGDEVSVRGFIKGGGAGTSICVLPTPWNQCRFDTINTGVTLGYLELHTTGNLYHQAGALGDVNLNFKYWTP